MPSGIYRDMVDIQRDVSTDDNNSPDYSSNGFVMYPSVPCQIEWTTGIETYRGRQLEANTDAVVEMHYMEGLLPTMRLRVTGGQSLDTVLHIRSVIPKRFRGMAEKVELFCTANPLN